MIRESAVGFEVDVVREFEVGVVLVVVVVVVEVKEFEVAEVS